MTRTYTNTLTADSRENLISQISGIQFHDLTAADKVSENQIHELGDAFDWDTQLDTGVQGAAGSYCCFDVAYALDNIHWDSVSDQLLVKFANTLMRHYGVEYGVDLDIKFIRADGGAAVLYQTEFNYGSHAEGRKTSDHSIFLTKDEAHDYVDREVARDIELNPDSTLQDETDFWTIHGRVNLSVDQSLYALGRVSFASVGFSGLTSSVSDDVVKTIWSMLKNWGAPGVRYLNDQIEDMQTLSTSERVIHYRYLLQGLNFAYQDLTRAQLHALLYVALGGDVGVARVHVLTQDEDAA